MTKHVRITGYVQGVSFRSSLKSIAESYRVTGWTRNLRTGQVEAVLQGAPSGVEEVLKWCRSGPELASVLDVEVKDIAEPKRYRNFVILH